MEQQEVNPTLDICHVNFVLCYRAATPHLQEMLSGGTKLLQLYTLPTCTPSRAALMTGRYPFRLELQTMSFVKSSQSRRRSLLGPSTV